MSDVVEIMARAMHAEYVNKRKGLTALWISHSEQYRESVRDEARAAIAALEAAGFAIVPKEPTEAMTSHHTYVNGEWSRRNWEAALSAYRSQP